MLLSKVLQYLPSTPQGNMASSAVFVIVVMLHRKSYAGEHSVIRSSYSSRQVLAVPVYAVGG